MKYRIIHSQLTRLAKIATLVLLITGISTVSAAENVTIVFRDDIPIHQQLADYLQNAIEKNSSTISVDLFPIAQEWPQDTGTVLLQKKTDKFLAIGDIALSFCLETAPDVPGIFLMLTNLQLVQKAESSGKWQGTKVWVDPHIQLAIIHDLMPDVRSIGTILTMHCNNCYPIFTSTASRYGLELKIIVAKERQQIIPAMKKLFQHSDVYLLLPAPSLLNNITLQELLRLQQEYNKALIVPAVPYVHMGALMSINYNLLKLAQYIGENIKLENGLLITPETMRKYCIEISINQEVAKRLDIKLNTGSLKDRIDINLISEMEN